MYLHYKKVVSILQHSLCDRHQFFCHKSLLCNNSHCSSANSCFHISQQDILNDPNDIYFDTVYHHLYWIVYILEIIWLPCLQGFSCSLFFILFNHCIKKYHSIWAFYMLYIFPLHNLIKQPVRLTAKLLPVCMKVASLHMLTLKPILYLFYSDHCKSLSHTHWYTFRWYGYIVVYLDIVHISLNIRSHMCCWDKL